MSKNLFQGLVSQIKGIIQDEFGILDESGAVIACTDDGRVGQSDPDVSDFLLTGEISAVIHGKTYYKVSVKDKLRYVVFIASAGKEHAKYLQLVSMNIVNIKSYHDEKFDKINFLTNLIQEKIFSGDAGIHARELHISDPAYRVVFLIKTQKTRGVFVNEIIQELFPSKSKDFILVLDDENLVLIRELKSKEDVKEIEKTATMIVDTLNTESMVKAWIGIGSVAENIADLARSYKEAQTAITVGSIFEVDKSVIHYDTLGLGRLIYQIPENLCRLFLNEVFKQGSFEALDSEYMLTIQKFFENNLNVSETSRQMFVHRNTLVYRLDKIQKVTGLDLTKFDDAIILKFALLVKRYLDKANK